MALNSPFQHHHFRQDYSIENSEGFVCCKLVLSRDKLVQKIVMTGTVLAFGIETMQDNNRGKTLTLLKFCKFLPNICFAVLSFANTAAMMFGSINPSLLQSFIFRCWLPFGKSWVPQNPTSPGFAQQYCQHPQFPNILSERNNDGLALSEAFNGLL